MSFSMTNTQELGLSDDVDVSDTDDISDLTDFTSPYNAKNILVSFATKPCKITPNVPGSNAYFSFQEQPTSQSSRLHESLLSDALTSLSDSSVHLPQTDFAPPYSRLGHHAQSWFETLRIKYLLFLASFLCFVAIITYFITPRDIDAWIGIVVQKLQFPTNEHLNIQMTITGHLYVTNPNYLPIILQSMKMDIYFNHTKYKNNIENEKNTYTDDCAQMYLLSFTNSWNELQNEQLYDVDYPFFVTINQNISDNTLAEFSAYVESSCKDTGWYILRAHIYTRYQYTKADLKLAFYTDTYVNQGCPSNKSSHIHKHVKT